MKDSNFNKQLYNNSIEPTISLMEIAEKIGDSRIKIDTRRKRISRIIASNQIKYTETSSGKQIRKSDVEKINKIYFEKFKNDKLLERTVVSSKNTELEKELNQKDQLINNIQKKNNDLLQEIDILNNQISDYKVQIREKDGQIKDLSERIGNAFKNSQELDYAKLKLDYQKKISEESGKVENMGKKLTDAQKQIINLQNDLNNKTIVISQRDISITKLDSKLKEQKTINNAQLKEQKYKLMTRSLIDRIRNKDITDSE